MRRLRLAGQAADVLSDPMARVAYDFLKDAVQDQI